MALVACGIGVGTCVTISPLLKVFYNLSTFEANLASLIYLMMYIPCNFISILVLKIYGLKVSVVIGAILTILGSWLRLFIVVSNFHIFIMGAAIAATG